MLRAAVRTPRSGCAQCRDAECARTPHNKRHDLFCVQAVSKVLAITNNLSTTVEASIRPGSSDRYTVHPQQVRLKPGQCTEVEVKLKVVRFAQIEKAVEQGQRDSFHIKTPYFDQKFSAVFFLSPQMLPPAAPGAPPKRPRHTSADRDAAHADEVVAQDAAHAPISRSTSADRAAAHGRSRSRGQERSPEPAPASPQTGLLRFTLPSSPAPLPSRQRPAEQGRSDADVEAHVAAAVRQALSQEHDAQEDRNGRVLEILQAKDAAIAEGQAAEEQLQQQARCASTAMSSAQHCGVVCFCLGALRTTSIVFLAFGFLERICTQCKCTNAQANTNTICVRSWSTWKAIYAKSSSSTT